MDTTALLASIPGRADETVCLLFEAGAQPKEDFLAFKAEYQHRLYSLYIHPQLKEFQNYGPWILEVDDKEQLKGYLETLPGCVAVIISTRYLPSLAVQLSHGCTIVKPDGETVLTRFYTSHVIEVLAARAENDWHAYLFNGITQWWLPAEAEWQRLNIAPSVNQTPTNPVIRLDKATWQQLSDKPEVSHVLREWRQMPSSQGISPCALRLMVLKALNKAESAGLEQPADRILYAICYLNGGKKMLESEAFCTALPRVIHGQLPLSQAISGISSKGSLN